MKIHPIIKPLKWIWLIGLALLISDFFMPKNNAIAFSIVYLIMTIVILIMNHKMNKDDAK